MVSVLGLNDEDCFPGKARYESPRSSPFDPLPHHFNTDSQHSFNPTQVNFAAHYLEDVWELQHGNEDPIVCSRVQEGEPSHGAGFIPAREGKFTIHDMSGSIPKQMNGSVSTMYATSLHHAHLLFSVS